MRCLLVAIVFVVAGEASAARQASRAKTKPAVLQVSADVQGAEVFVDDVRMGRVPSQGVLELEVKPGSRKLRVQAPGHPPFVTTVEAEAGRRHSIAARLSASPDALELELVPLAPLEPSPKAVRTPKPAPSPAANDDLELDLVPLMPELEPPPKKDPADAVVVDPPLTTIVAKPTDAEPPPDAFLVQTVEPAKPWYMEYWVWGAAAAVVAGGVVTAILLTRDGGDDQGLCVDGIFYPGERREQAQCLAR